jgi:hypothetical protein
MENLCYKLFKRIDDDFAWLIIAKRATSQDIPRKVLLEGYPCIKRKPRSQKENGFERHCAILSTGVYGSRRVLDPAQCANLFVRVAASAVRMD